MFNIFLLYSSSPLFSIFNDSKAKIYKLWLSNKYTLFWTLKRKPRTFRTEPSALHFCICFCELEMVGCADRPRVVRYAVAFLPAVSDAVAHVVAVRRHAHSRNEATNPFSIVPLHHHQNVICIPKRINYIRYIFFIRKENKKPSLQRRSFCQRLTQRLPFRVKRQGNSLP